VAAIFHGNGLASSRLAPIIGLIPAAIATLIPGSIPGLISAAVATLLLGSIPSLIPAAVALLVATAIATTLVAGLIATTIATLVAGLIATTIPALVALPRTIRIAARSAAIGIRISTRTAVGVRVSARTAAVGIGVSARTAVGVRIPTRTTIVAPRRTAVLTTASTSMWRGSLLMRRLCVLLWRLRVLLRGRRCSSLLVIAGNSQCASCKQN
jgi:hypothetical protein